MKKLLLLSALFVGIGATSAQAHVVTDGPIWVNLVTTIYSASGVEVQKTRMELQACMSLSKWMNEQLETWVKLGKDGLPENQVRKLNASCE